MDKNAIKKYAVWARNELIARVSQKALKYGITAEDMGDPSAKSIGDTLLTDTEVKQRAALIAQIKEKGFEQVMEEVSYTWFNRFAALRFMEVNGYLPSHVRVFTDDNNAFKPQILSEAIHLELDGLDMDKVYELKNDNRTEELFQYLLIVQCNALNAILPGMFQKIADYTELLLPDYLLREGSVVEQMVALIPEDDWKDQVQIIGWLYQYYNSELKDKAFEELKTTGRISKQSIPAATQLFTPDWIVRYMVQNGLGNIWMLNHPESDVYKKWDYYLTTETLSQKSNVGSCDIKPDEIRCIDPCAGSGHVLCYLFDALIDIYEDYGYSSREAASIIIQNNIYGLDLDERAAQLAYFSLSMKARQYDRRFFSKNVHPNIYAIKETNSIDRYIVDEICGDDKLFKKEIDRLIARLENAKIYGSLLDLGDINFDIINSGIEKYQEKISMYLSTVQTDFLPIVRAAELLGRTYDVTCTNPPYMGNKGFVPELLDYITKKYPEGKIDLYAAFIMRCGDFTKDNGVFSMVTPESWMFLSRFYKLRKPFLSQNTFMSLLHLGFNAFDSGFGTVAFVARKANIPDFKATCYRLVNYGSSEEKQQALLTTEEPYYSNKLAYEIVEGTPICYWVSDAMLENFSHPKVKDNGKTCVGLVTGNNDKFLRFWFEIDFTLLGIGFTHEEARKEEYKKWFPINQYGEYRKWYGNNMIVFDWWHDGFNIKKFKMDRYLAGEAEKKNSMCWNEDTYFMPGVTWNRISTDHFSARMSPVGNTAGSSSPIYFPLKREFYLLALFNSCVFSSIVAFLNPTVSFQTTDIEKVPVIYGDESIDDMAKQNVEIAKEDWDSFETSFEFKRSPLI